MPSRTRKIEILVSNMIEIKEKIEIGVCLMSVFSFCKRTASKNQMSDSEKLHSVSDTGVWCLDFFF